MAAKPHRGTVTGRTTADLDTETLQPVRSGLLSADEPLVPGLTILCHPDPSRIGEQAALEPLLHKESTTLARTEPEFCPPGQRRSRPLADPFLSRQPLYIKKRSQGFSLSGPLDKYRVVVNGELPSQGAPFCIDEAQYKTGVTIELAHRIALLFHPLPVPRGALPPAFGLVGHSEALNSVREEIQRVAIAEVPVLLRGESGTGKELVARALHQASARQDRPFHSVNMAAIARSTAASELFGHVKGAFTGAVQAAPGLFLRAHQGTLFLDEIGDTPKDVQVMLLRVLETGEVQPIGGGGTKRVDVRVIAATETDLDAAVDQGRFRLALVHRLAGYELRLPPLRDRRDDIARLLLAFLREELEPFGMTSRLDPPLDRRAQPWLPPSLVAQLVRFSWPGNVRQLRNVARQLAISSQGSKALIATARVAELVGSKKTAPQREPRKRKRPSEIQDPELVHALEKARFRPAAAAAALGVSRTTLYKLMDKSSAVRKAADLTEEEIHRCEQTHGSDLDAIAGALKVSTRALKLRLKRRNR